ncbi:hypothetical protein [Nonomuraea roseola]|uniref:Uncharacterized protein n=1 Tax=Nonomuraea roseola TaxID=46179 RepID=A0ABV5QCX3_9ACTN
MPGPSRRSLDDPDRHAGRWQGVPADCLAALTDHPFDLPESARVLILDTLGAAQPYEITDREADEHWPCSYDEWIAAAFRHHGVRRGPGAEPFGALRYYGLKGPLLVLCVGYGYLASTRLPDRDWYAVRHRGDVLVLTVLEPTPKGGRGAGEAGGGIPEEALPPPRRLAGRPGRLQGPVAGAGRGWR